MTAIANPRDKVGKTLCTLSLGMSLAGRGRKVLMVDMDPQGGLTAVCGLDGGLATHLGDVLGGALPGKVSLWDVVREVTPDTLLYLAPAEITLANTELGMLRRLGRELVLRCALQSVVHDFDVILLDCPSNLGMLTLNALAASETVIVPAEANAMHLRGLWFFLAALQQVRETLNSGLQTLGVFVTNYNRKIGHHRKAVAAMHAAGLPLVTRGDITPQNRNQPYPYPISMLIPEKDEAVSELVRRVESWLGSGYLQVRSPGV